MNKNIKISIIGLGYVGLPLCLKLSKYFKVIGYDISKKKIFNLKKKIDDNNEIKKVEFRNLKNITFSDNPFSMSSSDVFIITVPTPILINKRPDLKMIRKATEIVGKLLNPGNIVIYESTFYPGLTEEYCVPILKKFSKLTYNLNSKSFFCGYSPERINFGDKKNILEKINKLVSGSNKRITSKIYKIYSKIIKAKVIKASSIKVAESAKVIENVQRDVNIALINEFAMIFDKMNLNTEDILKAASTKWNFLNFKPGLVGGHCIGIDPYYLSYKAKKIGLNPKLILAGREINEKTTYFVFNKFLKILKEKKLNHPNIKILAMGCTFKENISDVRNSKSIELINMLKKKYQKVDVYDPHLTTKKVKFNKFTDIKNKYDAIIILVKHDLFKKINIKKLRKITKNKSVIFDVKYLYPAKKTEGRL